MAKPRSKHPGISIWIETQQGKEFLGFIVTAVGEDLRWEALDQTKDGTIVFCLEGCDGWGMLVEEREKPEGEFFKGRAAFRCLTASGFVLDATLTTYRWDPWLAAKATGDDSLINGSPSRRRRITAQRNAQAGRELDDLECKWRLPENAPVAVLGVPALRLDELKARRDAASPTPTTSRR